MIQAENPTKQLIIDTLVLNASFYDNLRVILNIMSFSIPYYHQSKNNIKSFLVMMQVN